MYQLFWKKSSNHYLNTKILKVCTQKLMLAGRANLGPIGQCDLTFRLGNKQFTDRFIILQDMQRNLILWPNWQYNYRIDCNWNVNGLQYITHNNKFLSTYTASSNMEPIIKNAETLKLPPRSISITSVQAPTELNTKHIYKLNPADDPSGIISLAVDHKIDHKYPKLLKILFLNTEHNTSQEKPS